MATSTIQTGLRLVKIPNNLFTWNSSNKFFVASITDVANAVELNSIVTFVMGSVTNSSGGICWSVGRTSGGNITVCGWIPKTAASIDDTALNYFDCYAIGY